MRKRHLRGQQRANRAYHEAGHAVVAERFGYEVFSVSIVPDERSDSRCIVEGPAPAKHLIRIAVVAGVVAEGLAAGEPGHSQAQLLRAYGELWSDAPANDLPSARMLEVIAMAMDVASTILSGYWPAVEALAAALCRQGEASGRWVRTLMTRVEAAEDSTVFH